MAENVWGKVSKLQHISSHLLSQVSSSSAAERNWSTYSFIHSVKRNRLTSKRAEKLVYVHGSLRLFSRKLPEYLASPTAQWDVDAEDAAQIDEDEDNPSPSAGLVGIPLDGIASNLGDDDDDDGDSEGVVRLKHIWIPLITFIVILGIFGLCTTFVILPTFGLFSTLGILPRCGLCIASGILILVFC